MENSVASFLETLSALRDLDLGALLASRVAKVFACPLEFGETVKWKEELAEKICDVFGFNEIETQPELLGRWHKSFDELPRRFLATFTPEERKNISGMRSVSWRLSTLVAKLDRLKIEADGKVFTRRQDVKGFPYVAVPPAAREARELRQVARAWRELELREFEQWNEFQTWLPREQKLFCWMYRRAKMSENGSTLWLRRSVESLAQKLECSQPTVKRALQGLRRREVIGWIVKGDQWRGSSRYWVARSVKSVRWGRVPKAQRRTWGKTPPRWKPPKSLI